MNNKYILAFSDIRKTDTAVVGGKNASLGEMISQLSSGGIRVPDGFATTASAFDDFLNDNNLKPALRELMKALDRDRFSNLKKTGAQARSLIMSARLPTSLGTAVTNAYRDLAGGKPLSVAVRSSATAEDLPQASFAGQHDSFLNIHDEEALLDALQRCFASLYNDRAIKYREDNGFRHEDVLISVGIQKMVRSDLSCSGVGFTLEPESGFRDIVHLSGVWGLGENIVQGTVNPDEFFVFKPMLAENKKAIIQKKLGDKTQTMVYGRGSATMNTETPPAKRDAFVLDDTEVTQLAQWAVLIEQHYGFPMDIEWAKDGQSNEMFIIQARPETVHAGKDQRTFTEYKLLQQGSVLASGQAIGSHIASGTARILRSPDEADSLRDGEIVVTDMTSPDWDPILKKAAAIVTNKGGRTSHASIVARELGVPAIVGCGNATESIRNGSLITISCAEGKTGFVYQGQLPYREIKHDFTQVRKPEHTKAMLITGDPDKAFQLSFFPNDGVGLMRMEFIITHAIAIHPMALVHFDQLQDGNAKEQIATRTRTYTDKEEFFVDRLSQGIATIAAAFYPKEVIVRMSDFKSNEYANLIGGKEFEPQEENPMLGFRGASRYYSPRYKEGFALECRAIRRVRNEMGLTNVKLMIPFCRTVEEGKKVIGILRENGLDRDKDATLEIYVMAEIPSNVILAEEFASVFDGFSIGSNDLTQLTLGIDRDSALVADLFDERNRAPKTMIGDVIRKAGASGTPIGLCGQAPSDYPEFAQFLVEQGIDSISFNADALVQGIGNIRKAEQKNTQLQPAKAGKKTIA